MTFFQNYLLCWDPGLNCVLQQLLDMASYRHCINELYCNIWQIMRNYYRIYLHELDKITMATTKDLLDDDPGKWLTPSSRMSSDFFLDLRRISYEVIEKSVNKARMLEACLGEIWLEVQKKLSTCLSSMSFELLKFDEFIEIITMSNKLVKQIPEVLPRLE